MNSQVKSKKRVKEHGEVFTAEREVKAMCDLIPCEIWQNIESTFLEPACGNGNILVEILKRKLFYCKDEKDGLKAINSLFGVDILADNVAETKVRLLEIYKEHFPNASETALTMALAILNNRIICDDCLNPKNEIVKSWGIEPDKNYLKLLEKRKKRENNKNESKI